MQDYEKVVPEPQQRNLGSAQCKITAYGGYPILKNLGSCQLYIHHSGDAYGTHYQITSEENVL